MKLFVILLFAATYVAMIALPKWRYIVALASAAIMIVSGALNVALNLLLVVVIPLDVAGVAIATSVSQLLSAVLVTVRLCTFRGPCRLELRKIRLYPDRTGQMLRLGFSAGLQGVIFSAAHVMIQSAVNSFGSVVIAGTSAAPAL